MGLVLVCVSLSALLKTPQDHSSSYCNVMHIPLTLAMHWGESGWKVVMWGRWPRAQIREWGRPDSGLCILLGEEICCCFIFIMSAVQTDVSLWSQPWERPLSIYGGLVCNSLMAGEFNVCMFFLHHSVSGLKAFHVKSVDNKIWDETGLAF